jgi:hypothetical protein
MKATERTFWSILLPFLSALSCGVLFFFLFSYSMRLQEYDNAGIVRFDRIAMPMFFVSVAWFPVSIVGVFWGAARKWELKPYLVLLAGCVLPAVVIFAASVALN